MSARQTRTFASFFPSPGARPRRPRLIPFNRDHAHVRLLMPERFGRLEPGSARGRVDSGKKTGRAADNRREEGSAWVEDRRPDLGRRDTHHDKHAKAW